MTVQSMTEEEFAAQNALIAEQNDRFRRLFGHDTEIRGVVLITSGVAARGDDFAAQVAAQVIAFDDFNEDNDPWGDHSFGIVEVEGEKVYWKIDLYDAAFEYGAEMPADPATTRRVLTMLLPTEY